MDLQVSTEANIIAGDCRTQAICYDWRLTRFRVRPNFSRPTNLGSNGLNRASRLANVAVERSLGIIPLPNRL